MRTGIRIWLTLICALLLTACGGDADTTTEQQEATNAAESTPPPSEEMTLAPLVWSESVDDETGGPTGEVTEFTTESPAIIVLIEAEHVPAGTEFVASWTINGNAIPEAEMQVEATGDMPHAWIAFKFTRADGQIYPVGTLGVEINVSNGDLIEDSVEIGFP